MSISYTEKKHRYAVIAQGAVTEWNTVGLSHVTHGRSDAVYYQIIR